MNVTTTQTPPKFIASQADIKPAPSFNEEQAIRDLFKKAADEGVDDLNATVVLPQAPLQEQPVPQAPLPLPALDVPAKFQKLDGTVDEEKLRTSTERLNEALQKKQENVKSIEEMLAEYKHNEKDYWSVSRKESEIKKQLPVPSAAPAPIPTQEDPQQLQQRILQDYNRDPLGTGIALTQALLDQRLAPIMARIQQEEEHERDSMMRQNLVNLAERDPRVAHPQLYAELINELKSDPHYFQLKNPHKAAWNEVKERLRLGEVTPPPAQPSTPSPTLGRGIPPPVSGLPQPMSPQNLSQQAGQINPYSHEGKEFEARLREATRDLWQ